MTGKTEAPSGLIRSLGPFGVSLLTLSVLSPAASVLVAGADIVHQVGTGAIWAFLVGALLTAVLTTNQAELSAAFPLAGGDYATVGHTLGPLGGFLLFSSTALQAPVFVALTSSGVAIYLQPVFPGLPVLAVTLTTIALAMAISILNIKTNAFITGVFLTIEVGALLLIAGLGLAHPARPLVEPLIHPLTLGAGGILVVMSVGLLAVAANGASWAVSGANQAVYFSEEMKRPRRVGHLIMVILALTVVLEVAPVLGFAVGAHDLKHILGADSPFIAFISEGAAPWLAKAVSLAVAAAIFNAAVAGVVGLSRMAYSTGRDRIWNAAINRSLTQLHPRFNSPWIAALVIGGLSMAASLLSLNMLVLLAASSNIACYLLLALAHLKGRRAGLTGTKGFRSPLFPLIPVLSLVLIAGMTVAQFMDAQSGRPALLITVAVLAAGWLYYRLVLRRRPGGWRLSGPADIVGPGAETRAGDGAVGVARAAE